jgi:hypothetical protein
MVEAPAATAIRELWIELMARLAHTLQECAKPDAARRLRERGVRAGTVVRHLAREYIQASRMGALCGVELQTQDAARRLADRSLELTLRDDLDHGFRGLAITYKQLLLALAPTSGNQFHQWLEGRSRVHAAQAQSLASATHNGPPSIDLGAARDPPAAATLRPVYGCKLASASQPVLPRHQRNFHE